MESLFLESTVRATLLITSVALVLWALRIRTAAVRHAAWASVVAGMLLLPMFVAWGPQVSLAVLPEQAPSVGFSSVILETGGDAVATPSGSIPVEPVIAARWTWQDYAVGVYLAGLGLFLMRLAVGTFQVRCLLNSAELDRGKLVHTACSAPITVGCFRPTVILPSGWAQWPQAQLAAVLAHEGEHIRRRDPLFQWLALLNRAIFWFHPLAWWLEKRLSGLAEEVCDAAVLAQGHDPAEYSRYLLAMARTAQESGARVQALGMAMPGVGLRERIRNIMKGARAARVSRTRLTCIAILIAGAEAVLSTGVLAHAQQSSATFDAASIKPTPMLSGGAIMLGGPATGGPGTADPTHIRWVSVTLKSVLALAYDVKPYQVTGPAWFDAEHYDFAVSVPEGATKAQVAAMWRKLLAERFGIVVHHESKEFPVDELRVARGGHKLKSAVVSGTAAEGPPKVENGRLVGPGMITMMRANGGKRELMAVGQELAGLVTMLGNQLGHPVVDKTGLTGKYDFNVEYAPGPSAQPGAESLTPSDPALDLGTAVQQQLGLRFERGTAMLGVVVVDKADKVPTEN